MVDNILDKLITSRIVAVVRKVDSNKVDRFVHSLITGGVTSIEITLDSKKALEKINSFKEKYDNQIVIGAGTVLNEKQAKEAITAGADFIFAPILDRKTIEITKDKGKIMIPGALTPTEIYQGHRWGADIVKVFPANVLGPQFIKDIKAPLGEVTVMPTGGITLNNIKNFFEAGSAAAGIGGSLVKKDLIEQEKWEEINNLARHFKKIANESIS